MKKVAIVLAAAWWVAACTPSEPEVVTLPVPQESAPVVANAESNLFVSGMTCVMGCKGAIEKDLNNTPGIESFTIVFEDSTAVVKYDSTLISENDILEAVAAVGGGNLYTATAINP